MNGFSTANGSFDSSSRVEFAVRSRVDGSQDATNEGAAAGRPGLRYDQLSSDYDSFSTPARTPSLWVTDAHPHSPGNELGPRLVGAPVLVGTGDSQCRRFQRHFIPSEEPGIIRGLRVQTNRARLAWALPLRKANGGPRSSQETIRAHRRARPLISGSTYDETKFSPTDPDFCVGGEFSFTFTGQM
jgi:hypothetical protein